MRCKVKSSVHLILQIKCIGVLEIFTQKRRHINAILLKTGLNSLLFSVGKGVKRHALPFSVGKGVVWKFKSYTLLRTL